MIPTQLTVTNYRALRDVTIPLSRFGCLIGENNSGKSTVLLALSQFFSGSKLTPSHFFDASKPVRIAVTFEQITDADLARLAIEHRIRVKELVSGGRLTLVRFYGTDGKSALLYSKLMPTDPRFSAEQISELAARQRPGPAFVKKVVDVFPELDGQVDDTMDKAAMERAIENLADSLPDKDKATTDRALPTGIDKSIEPMLPEPIYIPAVKDLADDLKTSESTPFGKILSILLRAVGPRITDAEFLFRDLNEKLNRIRQADDSIVDNRLEEVRLIESTVEKFVRESFTNVSLRITIPPPELKTIFSSASISANDGIDGAIETKGDGLRRAIVFSILRAFVELRASLSSDAPALYEAAHNGGTDVKPAPATYMLLFEEPEIFLHPKAQHVLFDALRLFSAEHLVVVTTHSPIFLGPRATGTFVRLRKIRDETIAVSPFTAAWPITMSDMSARDQFQLICFENNSGAFFADTVVLVEGDSDHLVMPHIARTLDAAWDTARRPVHFARIAGKANVKRYRNFFGRFSVRVAVIADLDLLVNGFQHVEPDDALTRAHSDLMQLVDGLIVEEDDEVTSKEANAAHDSGELRGLWRRVKELTRALEAGECTQAEVSEAVEVFFAWQRKAKRLDMLQHSVDDLVIKKKHELLEMLRARDIYVLERGALEQYYPDNIKGVDKPSKALDFCEKVASREALLACCGDLPTTVAGETMLDREFVVIFRAIFDGEDPTLEDPPSSGSIDTQAL